MCGTWMGARSAAAEDRRRISRMPTCCPGAHHLDNVMLPLEIVTEPYRSTSRRRAIATKEARQLLACGPGRLGDKQFWELSGGMQQRASICRALIHQPFAC